MIRVGRCTYDHKGVKTDPTFPNFVPIVVVMKSHSRWYPLSPYYLTDEKGRIMENYWQFSKIYRNVGNSEQKKSRYDKSIIWSHPAETHVVTDNGIDKITNEYKQWRNKGMHCKEPIRYPVGFYNRHNCMGAYVYKTNPDGSESDEIDTSVLLDYISSRKQIYIKKYCELVKQHPLFLELKEMMKVGINLLIVDVDGPHQESIPYYVDTYHVSPNFIQQDTVLINQENINILLNDPKHPFGHGYCLAMALMDKDIEWNV